jgi:hypothetical protein
MLLLISRPARPEAAYWQGRRSIAALDAVAWPALWMIVISRAPFSTGIVGTAAMTLIVLVAVRRLHRAIFRNPHYEFTTLRWGIVLAGMLAIGAGLKLFS